MKVKVTRGSSATVAFTKEGYKDPDFEAVVREFEPEERHPEDFTVLVVRWEEYLKR